MKAQTIEQTGKGWKAAQLAGALLFLLGFGACIAASAPTGFVGAEKDDRAMAGTFAALAGFFVWLFGRIGAWWNHG